MLVLDLRGSYVLSSNLQRLSRSCGVEFGWTCKMSLCIQHGSLAYVRGLIEKLGSTEPRSSRRLVIIDLWVQRVNGLVVRSRRASLAVGWYGIEIKKVWFVLTDGGVVTIEG